MNNEILIEMTDRDGKSVTRPFSPAIAEKMIRKGEGRASLGDPPARDEKTGDTSALKKKPETPALIERIRKLEKDVATKAADVEKAEQALTEAFAGGKDSTAAVRAVTDARAELAILKRGLIDLDRHATEASRAENAKFRDALAASVRADYLATLKSIDRDAADFAEKIGGNLPASARADLSDRVADAAASAVWSALNDRFSREFAELVPMPYQAPERGVPA